MFKPEFLQRFAQNSKSLVLQGFAQDSKCVQVRTFKEFARDIKCNCTAYNHSSIKIKQV